MVGQQTITRRYCFGKILQPYASFCNSRSRFWRTRKSGRDYIYVTGRRGGPCALKVTHSPTHSLTLTHSLARLNSLTLPTQPDMLRLFSIVTIRVFKSKKSARTRLVCSTTCVTLPIDISVLDTPALSYLSTRGRNVRVRKQMSQRMRFRRLACRTCPSH